MEEDRVDEVGGLSYVMELITTKAWFLRVCILDLLVATLVNLLGDFLITLIII